MTHIPPTSHHLLAAKQEPWQKAYVLTKNIEEFSGGNSEENGPAGRDRKEEEEEEKTRQKEKWK